MIFAYMNLWEGPLRYANISMRLKQYKQHKDSATDNWTQSYKHEPQPHNNNNNDNNDNNNDNNDNNTHTQTNT